MNYTINPSTIGDYIKTGRSEKDLRLIEEKDDLRERKEWKEGFKNINPVAKEEGWNFEDFVYEKVLKHVDKKVDTWKEYDNQEKNDEKIIELIKESYYEDKTIALTQAKLSGTIEEFYVPGDADLIILDKKDGVVRIKIFDVKSAWEEKTQHRIQAATYSILIDKVINDSNFNENYSIETGIINKGQKEYGVEDLPTYNKDIYERDIVNLLSKGGDIYKAYQNNNPNYSLEKEGEESFEPKINESLENKNIRILGLTRGEQEAFKEVGLESIEKIADIIEITGDLKPYNTESIEIKQKYLEKINHLEEDHGLSKDIKEISLKAKRYLDVINPESKKALSNSQYFGDFDMAWIPGSGQGNLPSDDPPYDANLGFKNGSMVRIYLNVQRDFVNDSIAGISARVTSSLVGDNSQSISNTRNILKGDKKEMKEDELSLVENFIADTYIKIKEVVEESTGSEEAPIHFYFWDKSEYNNLIQVLEDHREKSKLCESLLNILSQREGIEQKIYSILQKEIRDRIVTKSFVDGPLPVAEEFSPYETQARFSLYKDLEYIRSDGEKIDLSKDFRTGLTDYKVPYTNGNSFKLHYEEEEIQEDGYYCVLPRFTSQIPIEYLWGSKEHDLLEPDWSEKPMYSSAIENYRYLSTSENTRIKVEDYEKMMEKMCHAMHNIERAIKYRNSDIDKKEMDIKNLRNYSLDRNNLNESCLDYMKMEYQAEKKENTKHYSRSIKQRVLTGKSIPIEIKNIKDSKGGKEVKAELIYEKLGFNNPELGIQSCRVDPNEKESWMLASPIKEKDGQWVDKISSRKILHSPVVILKEMSKENKNVKFKTIYSKGSKSDNYREWHKSLGRDNYPLEEGEKYILDPQSDDTLSERKKISLENCRSNYVYNLLEKCLKGSYDKSTGLKKEKLENFYQWVKQNDTIITPNTEQKKFITNDKKLNILQGPPGTGKTSGAISNSLISRVLEISERKDRAKIVVSGTSNKSIEEVLVETSRVLKTYNENKKDSQLANTRLVRLTSNKPDPQDKIDNVEYINHHHDEKQFIDLIENGLTASSGSQSKIGDNFEVSKPQNIVLFTTPANFHNLAKKHPLVNNNKDNKKQNSEEGAEKIYSLAPKMFDCLLIDEASMMTLPEFINLGAFLENDSQILISGDHRQMPPVQKHDWEEENRLNIKKNLPFLSILDYMRFLRGEDLQAIEENNICKSPELDIEIIGLNISYRCHEKVSDILNRWIYDEDNVDYKSKNSKDMKVTGITEQPFAEIFKEEANIVLIAHDDYNNQQMSLTEGKISKEIVKRMPENETRGIVTPHNSQKGLLKSISKNDIQIDTVERYQGGEKDSMIVSATVSDLDFLKQESDFILSPNRLNVAVSRMKKKLIIIAPRTIFKMMPNDNNKYENSKLWKSMFDEVSKKGVKWSGKLSDFTGKNEKEVNIKIYSK